MRGEDVVRIFCGRLGQMFKRPPPPCRSLSSELVQVPLTTFRLYSQQHELWRLYGSQITSALDCTKGFADHNENEVVRLERAVTRSYDYNW